MTAVDAVGAPSATTARRLASPGSQTVDWEERVNPERLRTYRLARAREALDASPLGAVLLFDFNNIRYVTSTHIGEWARDKMTRYALQTRGGTPHIWDFGSAAKHHRLNCPWLAQENVHAGMIGLRGAVAPDAGLFRRAAREICEILRAEGVLDMPLGVDLAEPPMVAALEAEGITVRDAQIGFIAAERQAHIAVIPGVHATAVVLARLLQFIFLASGLDMGLLTIVGKLHRHQPIVIALEGHAAFAHAQVAENILHVVLHVCAARQQGETQAAAEATEVPKSGGVRGE